MVVAEPKHCHHHIGIQLANCIHWYTYGSGYRKCCGTEHFGAAGDIPARACFVKLDDIADLWSYLLHQVNYTLLQLIDFVQEEFIQQGVAPFCMAVVECIQVRRHDVVRKHEHTFTIIHGELGITFTVTTIPTTGIRPGIGFPNVCQIETVVVIYRVVEELPCDDLVPCQ